MSGSAVADTLGKTDMLGNLLSDEMFKFTDFLNGSAFSENSGLMVKAAMAIAFLLWVLQIAKDVYSGALGENNWKEKIFFSLIKVGIIFAIIGTGGYKLLMQSVIGGIPETIASTFADSFMVKFMEKQSEFFGSFSSGNGGGGGGFLKINFMEGAVVSLISAGAYFTMNAVALVLPMAQRCFFELCCYLGPFAFVFLLCDWTKGIFDKWLSMSLAISWLSVISALVMYIYVFSCMPSAIAGATGGDVFSVAIMSMLSIAMMISAPSMAVYLFGASGSGVEKAGGWGAISSAAVAGGKAALPAAGAAVGGLKSAGYNEDGSKKSGAGAAIARVAHSAGSMVVKGSVKPQSVSSELTKSLMEGKKSSGGGASGASDGNSKLGGGSSVPSGSGGNSSGGGGGGGAKNTSSGTTNNSSGSGSSVPSSGKK